MKEPHLFDILQNILVTVVRILHLLGRYFLIIWRPNIAIFFQYHLCFLKYQGWADKPFFHILLHYRESHLQSFLLNFVIICISAVIFFVL